MTEEIIQMQQEEEIIYNSMICTYMILTQQSTFEELFESGEDFGVMFSPDDVDKIKGPIALNLIEFLIDYFVELEDYEKCQDLVDSKEFYIKKKK